MPELAEVETVRKIVDRHMRGKKIKEVEVDLQDKYLFQFVKPAAVRAALEGAKVTGTGRRGKYFWIEFGSSTTLIIHLGMTGNVSIRLPRSKSAKPNSKTIAGDHLHIWGGVALQSEGAKKTDRPEQLWFCRLLIRVADGTEIAIVDPRRFGRVWLSDDPLNHSRIKKLGPDPMIDFPKARPLYESLRRRKASIKAVLLDQSLFAGIGNWLADEVLFHAKLSPHRKAFELSEKEVTVLRASILSVVNQAVSVDADYNRFPKTWLFHHRWGKSKNAQTSSGAKIIHEDIGGRTAAWVPSRQK